MRNVASKVTVPDGSVLTLGDQGNAIEMSAADGLTIFADPNGQAAPVPIWYAPADTSNYFNALLALPESSLASISVFKMYEVMLQAPDATLKQLFTFLSAHDIKLSIEAMALVAAPGQPGDGVEGYSRAGDLVTLLSRVQALGGKIDSVVWDEPWLYGHVATGNLTIDQVAAQVATASQTVRAMIPGVQIGDIEPVGVVPGGAAALQAWFTTYAAAAGKPFDFVQADVTYWEPGWQAGLAAMLAGTHAAGLPVGVIVDGMGAPAGDTAWATAAVAAAQQIESDPALRPGAIVVQSWQTNPSEAATPATAGTLASVEADIADGTAAANAIPAAAHYSTAGVLLSVVWSGGYTAAQDGQTLRFTDGSGTVIQHIALDAVAAFAFDPAAARVLVTLRTGGAYDIGVGPNGFAFDPAGAPATGRVTVALAAASMTGIAGSNDTNRTMPTLAGTAPAGAVLAASVDGVADGSAVANAQGAWTYTLSAALANGIHDVRVTTNGGTLASSLVVSVNATPAVQPVLSLAPGNDSGYAGDGITDVLQPVLTGQADANASVAISVDGRLADTVISNDAGQFGYALTHDLTIGSHAITAIATNAWGSMSSVTTLALTIDTAAAEHAATAADPLFDQAWYVRQHPEVQQSGQDPYTHYLTTGWKEGFDPSPFFSTAYYLAHNPDVAASGMNPLLHFESYGWMEGRDPSAAFSTVAYFQAHAVPAGTNPLLAYLQTLNGPAASAAVDAAAPHDTFMMSGGTPLFIVHDGAQAGTGAAPMIASAFAASGLEQISNFTAQNGAFIELLGGVGGFTSAQAVLNAVSSDGAGGSLLQLGGGKSIDFLSSPPASLQLSQFKVG